MTTPPAHLTGDETYTQLVSCMVYILRIQGPDSPEVEQALEVLKDHPRKLLVAEACLEFYRLYSFKDLHRGTMG